MKTSAKYLVWLDCEMTGLDPDKDTILEVAAVITDNNLMTVAVGPDIVVHHPDLTLSRMGSWCRKQHGKSGLTERVRLSTTTMRAAELQMIRFLRMYCRKGKSPLCGNSIGHDRRFLARFMPKLHDFFHYQSIDVSTVKQLVRRWYPATFRFPPKKDVHLAIPDIMQSIAELRHYRKKVFRT